MTALSFILGVLLTLLLSVFIALIIVVPIVLFWWWLKSRKIRKNIPEDMSGLIKEEKLKTQEVEDEKNKREKEREKRRGEAEGRERIAEKPVGDTGTKGDVRKQQRVQVSEASKDGKAKRVVKLHKPTAL